MTQWPEPFSANGTVACLVPLSHDHRAELEDAAADGDLHRLWYTTVPRPDEMEAEIDRRLSLQKTGSVLPFSVIEQASGKAVGMTIKLAK